MFYQLQKQMMQQSLKQHKSHENNYPTLLLPVKCKDSQRLSTLHVEPTQIDYRSMGKKWHKYQITTITKYTHMCTEIWFELQLKSAVLAE